MFPLTCFVCFVFFPQKNRLVNFIFKQRKTTRCKTLSRNEQDELLCLWVLTLSESELTNQQDAALQVLTQLVSWTCSYRYFSPCCSLHSNLISASKRCSFLVWLTLPLPPLPRLPVYYFLQFWLNAEGGGGLGNTPTVDTREDWRRRRKRKEMHSSCSGTRQIASFGSWFCELVRAFISHLAPQSNRMQNEFVRTLGCL